MIAVYVEDFYGFGFQGFGFRVNANLLVKDKHFLKTETKGKDKCNLALIEMKISRFFIGNCNGKQEYGNQKFPSHSL